MVTSDKAILQPFIPILTYALVTFIAVFLCACAYHGKPDSPKNVHHISSVPFFDQKDYQCGPSALAGVLNFYGVHVLPEEVADEIFSTNVRGTFMFDMLIYAQKKGLYARQYRGDIKNLQENIIKNQPLIVMVNFGNSLLQENHFMVVTGYNYNGFIVQSGNKRSEHISFEKFHNIWNKANNWTLLITQHK
jgi:predicted double-glycine peptidase